MLVLDKHNRCHVGTEWLLSQLRMKYWIIKARSVIKQVKRKCVTCRRLYAPPASQKMADLPPDRCSPGGPPFQTTGVDVFGPFYVKVGRAQVKRYGCIYSCFSTRAIHIEKLDGLDTDTFINGFVRFVSRRSCPRQVLSDNGTNIVGAYNELRRSFDQIDKVRVLQDARRRNVDWQFNPPLASHMGGLWERMIRAIRRVLCALLNSNTRMTDDVLHTIFCEVENIINSRPLTKASDDVNDESVITPNHFLLLSGNYSVPWVRREAHTDVCKWRTSVWLALSLTVPWWSSISCEADSATIPCRHDTCCACPEPTCKWPYVHKGGWSAILQKHQEAHEPSALQQPPNHHPDVEKACTKN